MPPKTHRPHHHYFFSTLVISLTVLGSLSWFMSPPLVTQGDSEIVKPSSTSTLVAGKHVVINTATMSLSLYDGTTHIETFPLLSKGKPGSYYETIGGVYANDYKMPLHFSSIGHVYMPYSVHVFGNYFIHGVPYYPDGTQVSSTYSGGCVRLANRDAKKVYEFVEKGTPIIITQNSKDDFEKTDVSTTTFESQIMTNYMVATISLEALTQDNEIRGIDGEYTTRRKLLPQLIRDNNTLVSNVYARYLGESMYLELMNAKAESLGLTQTHFTSVTEPVTTSYEDYMRFMTYISTYKSYIRTIEASQ
jgi:hypothetical protein